MSDPTRAVTRPAGALLLLGTLSIACSSRSDEPAARRYEDPRCEGISNAYECAQQVERDRLAADSVTATRRGDTLLIPAAEGDVRLVDRDAGGPENVFYSYRDYLPGLGFHVVDIHYWEGGAHLLVDDSTGERTRVPGPPVVSPDRRRLVVASEAGVAGYAPNALQVWQVTPSGLALEWEVRPDDWGAAEPRWQDAVTVRFLKTGPCPAEPSCYDDAVLRLRDGEWEVTTP